MALPSSTRVGISSSSSMTGSPGSDCHVVLGRVKLDILLNSTLQPLALVSDDFARLFFKRCCLDTHGAGGCLVPLVHPSGVATVGGCPDIASEALPVFISRALGGPLSLARSCSESGKGFACKPAGLSFWPT